MIEGMVLTSENAESVAAWCGGVIVSEYDAIEHSISFPGINIQCGSEVKRASVGQVVILKDDGSFDVLDKA